MKDLTRQKQEGCIRVNGEPRKKLVVEYMETGLLDSEERPDFRSEKKSLGELEMTCMCKSEKGESKAMLTLQA